jgi:hypothetical protein
MLSGLEVLIMVLLYALALPSSMSALHRHRRYQYSYRSSLEDVVGFSLARALLLSFAYAWGAKRHQHRCAPAAAGQALRGSCLQQARAAARPGRRLHQLRQMLAGAPSCWPLAPRPSPTSPTPAGSTCSLRTCWAAPALCTWPSRPRC